MIPRHFYHNCAGHTELVGSHAEYDTTGSGANRSAGRERIFNVDHFAEHLAALYNVSGFHVPIDHADSGSLETGRINFKKTHKPMVRNISNERY